MQENGKPTGKFNITFFLLSFITIVIIQNVVQNSSVVEKISYSNFLQLLKSNKKVSIEITGDTISGSYLDEGSKNKFFSTQLIEPNLSDLLDKYNVEFKKVKENTFLKDILSWILPTALFIGIWLFIARKFASSQMGGGLMQVGKSKAKVYVQKDTGVNFDDIAGVDEAKENLIEIVNFLKEPEAFGRLGAKMPKGILLVGPPGTGKTLLAKAVAGEAKVPFFSISGSEFVEMFVGVGAARVRDLFQQASKSSPCIIFIDELDALGKQRGVNSSGGGHDEKEQTLNQLLTELDGFNSDSGIILLGATNRPEVLDPALLRSGRFDRQVLVDRPDLSGRKDILKVHLKKIKADSNLDIPQIAMLTTGFTGADLANLVNEAALEATRKNRPEVTIPDFIEAIERIVAGLEKKSRVLSEFERKVVAFHEMGHAIVGIKLERNHVVQKISIIPRGIGALGYTIHRPLEDRMIIIKEELLAKISVLLGGRAAEILVFNHLSTGASDDIVKATNIARDLVTKYGMSDPLGFVAYETSSNLFLGQNSDRSKNYGGQIETLIDQEIKKIITESFERAFKILSENRELLNIWAEKLLSKETLGTDDLANLQNQLI